MICSALSATLSVALSATLSATLSAMLCQERAAAQGMPWAPSVPAALAAAKADQRVIALVFDLPGVRGSDELVGEHCKNASIARLAARTANVFCSTASAARVTGITPGQQQTNLQQARLDVLKVGPGDDVIAPQVVFCDADGNVLSAVPGRTTTGELEWAWVDAIRRVDPSFEWQYGPAARAPRRLQFGTCARGQNREPPTEAQVDEALKAVRKARGAAFANLQSIELLLRSDEPDAISYVEGTLNGLQAGWIETTLTAIGANSPRAYHAIVAPYLAHREDDVRRTAAAALEQLAEPKALAPVLRRLKVEKVDPIKGRLLRAAAASGPTSKELVAQIDKVLAKEDVAELRAHAVLALALVEDRPHVQQGLAAALRDVSAMVRSTAAYALAWRRDAECVRQLEEAADREDDAETKAWLAAAVTVVRGGDARAFDNFVERVLGEAPPRLGPARGPGRR